MSIARTRIRVAFVGRLIELKRVRLLIEAISGLASQNVELAIIGTGPLEGELRTMAEALLPGRVLWIGVLPIEEVPKHMAQADCLVLPSRHDGWGAVVSEALMVGTPAICSDRCGAAGVVLASRRGGVFPSGDVGALTTQLQRIVDGGRQSWQQRAELADWAKCLGAEAGATYLTEILRYVETGGARPAPPWEGAGSARDQTSIGSLLS
ncbi:glycosyltransferase [Kaistia sp. UC242_56]|uniref:glycosyltransferase n=1 Tax=Kaistia sp. UC242_56 TaxID=3374625 RepID=UPI0037B10B43